MAHSAKQSDFYHAIGEVQRFQELFERIPDVYFFAKDCESRLMCASSAIVKRFGLHSEDQLIGSTDHDYFPSHIASKFVSDDQRVILTGEPLIGRVEIWYTEQRLLDWFITDKLPIRDTNNKIVGVMGIVRSYEGSHRSLQTYTPIDKVVEYIRENLHDRISVAMLAEVAGLSPRQLHRKFSDFFGMNVQEFVSRTRIQAASSALLNSDETIVDIALRFGFCDQSAFTQQFKKFSGVTPLRFRKEHGK